MKYEISMSILCFIIFSSGVKVVRRTTSARLSEVVRSLAWMLVFCPHNWITRSWYCFSGINQPSSLVDTHTLYTIQMEKREAECQLLMFVEIEASIAVVFLQYIFSKISSKMNQKKCIPKPENISTLGNTLPVPHITYTDKWMRCWSIKSERRVAEFTREGEGQMIGGVNTATLAYSRSLHTHHLISIFEHITFKSRADLVESAY